MSYNASQFEDITDALHRKNGKKVPKDQDDLLLQSDSWIHQLRQRPHGMANVPTRVLETVTAAYTNAIRKQSSHAAQPVASIEPEELEASQQSDVPGSSPEVALEWSQSPERPRSGHSHMPELSVVEETPHPKLGQPTFQKPVTTLRRPFHSTLLSSLEEEEDLEVQVPRGDNDTEMEEAEDEEDENCQNLLAQVPPQVSLEFNALVANTPPTCAQQEHEIIPGTVMAEKAKTVQQNAGQRPSKRMKPILIDDDSPVKSRQNISIVNGGRMRSLKHLEIVTQDTVVSSSIVPATLAETQTQRQKASGTTQDTAEEENRREGMSDVEENSSSAAEDEVAKSTELQRAKSQVSVHEDDSHNAEDEGTGPFGKFKMTYPDYETSFSGTRLDFVKACLCLEYLRNKRALRDYMYDEFIRLFSHKYIAYVNNAGPNREPLSAIEWFNIQGGPPLYRQQIISNQNLEQVLAFYDDDTAAIRTLVAEHEEEEAAEMHSASQVTIVESEDGDVGEQEHKASETRLHDEMDVDSPPRLLAADTVVSEGMESPTRTIPTELPAVQPMQAKSTPIQGRTAVAPAPFAQSSKIQRTHIKERPAISPPPSVKPVKTTMRPALEKAAVAPSFPVAPVPVSASSPRVAAATVASPQLGSRTFAALPPPPSSMRSNASVGTQYMQQLSARTLPTSEEAAQQRRERMRAAMRKRASNGARSTSSKAS
ncbi:hypothetical protein NQ176_g8864 [Zarea fungicola]|uniref:Uncharacterized protein n=1 Tax=Zarea fungicola TaxID=93591 RepID=A0ACC1MQG5_9HYPO|nr:hypothetical protein NQ176_g8864 [Lecanicillium fungicola]